MHSATVKYISAALLLGGALTASLLLGGVACSRSDGAQPPERPRRDVWKPPAPVNVVLILIDTLRADAVLDPEGKYDTPNIDRLASEGTTFTRVYSAAPMTLPSHASLFSSRPLFETKVLNNGQAVPDELPLLADWLAAHGYDTRAVISLGTLNPPPSKRGISRGFAAYDWDYWCLAPADDTHARLLKSLDARAAAKPLFLFAHFSDPHEPYNAHGSEQADVELRVDGELLEKVPVADEAFWTKELVLSEGRTVFEFTVPEATKGRFRLRLIECTEDGEKLELKVEGGEPPDQAKIMGRSKSLVLSVDRGDRPPAKCTLRAWMNDVPPNDESRKRRYAHEVAFVDRYVGELLARLDELGLYQDSLIVFTSDHGEAMGELRNPNGAPFFGHADGVTDEQIHVPLIVRLPRNDPRRAALAATSKRVVTQLDVVPTLLEIVGVEALPGQIGNSLFAPHDSVHVAQAQRPEARRNQIALRDERFKMIFYADAEEGSEAYVMYDLVQDPGETKDVFQQQKGERPEWPATLQKLYERSKEEFDAGESALDKHTLDALGYGGDHDEGEAADAADRAPRAQPAGESESRPEAVDQDMLNGLGYGGHHDDE